MVEKLSSANITPTGTGQLDPLAQGTGVAGPPGPNGTAVPRQSGYADNSTFARGSGETSASDRRLRGAGVLVAIGLFAGILEAPAVVTLSIVGVALGIMGYDSSKRDGWKL